MNPLTWLSRRRQEREATAARVEKLRDALAAARAAVAAWKDRHRSEAERTTELKARVASLEARLHAMRAAAEGQRQLRERYREREVRMVGSLSQLRTALDWAKAQAQRTHRGVLSPRVLRRSLPSRLAVANARADRPSAREDESRFLQASASYGPALAAARQPPDAGAQVVSMKLQGLQWWVPVMRPGDAEPGSPWRSKQKFPYRGIAQTRELAMGGIMLDLGANLGRMTLPRVILGDVTAAYCAEPDPLNYDCLVRNVVDNGLRGLVFPDNVAVGDREGTARLARQRNCGAHTLIGGVHAKIGFVDVPVVTLDAWVARLGIDPNLITFIKMDVQGWEGHVLAGAGDMLRRSHVSWQVEYKPAMLRDAGTVPEELCRLFAEHFTHFTDLNKDATGARARSIAELTDAVRYVHDDPNGQTDLLLFTQLDRVSG